MAKKQKADNRLTPNEQALNNGLDIIKHHPLFRRLSIHTIIDQNQKLSKGTAAVSYESGDILLNPNASHTPQEWSHIIAHCMMHLCFDHFNVHNKDKKIWNIACDIFIEKFLNDIKFGTPVVNINELHINASDENKIYDIIINNNIDISKIFYGTAERGEMDMYWNGPRISYWYNRRLTYAKEFSYAVSDSVRSVINEAGGISDNDKKSIQTQAAEWFINHYPLLGGLASGFSIIQVGYGSNSNLCSEISTAAIDVLRREIYVNSAANLSLEEWKFILAHEYLHAGLQHHERRQGRDNFLWNVACDYVINGWLNDMHIGIMPADGLLYDEKFKQYSAEEIYDIISKDIRKFSKLKTFRGYGIGDILDEGYAESKCKPVSIDDFCKNALRNGLEYHTSNNRGFIPAGLIEEIKALSMPPVPWDVELAKWFDTNFASIEKRRTYARPSRRQSSTPDIPRPSYIKADISEYSRTYAVIIDTSCSMTTKMIGMALGAAASYSAAKDVPFVRVIFCDARPYDIGYVSPEDIAGRVEIQGRGGTVIQPAVDLIENAKNFPKNGPILIITDGYIENNLTVKHEHAFLIPEGNRLPFKPRGKVFYFK